MKAMILAAGYGTRLWPLTADRTKPAIPFLGKPLVGYVAEYLAGYGFNDVVVNLHHRPESVREALGDGSKFGVKLNYVIEEEILGTSGALDNAKELLAGDTFLVINGKIITDIDLSKAYETHKKTGAIATLVLLPNYKRERFSQVITKEGTVIGFGGMPDKDSPSDNAGNLITHSQNHDFQVQHQASEQNAQSSGLNPQSAIEAVPLMFTGIQFLEPKIFDYIPRGVFSHSVTDVYPKAWESGELVAAHVAEGKWYELSTIQRYLEISLIVNEGNNNGVIDGNGNTVSKDANVVNTILWDEITIEPDAVVRNSIIGDGVKIKSEDVFEDVVVVRRDLIEKEEPPPKALKGVVMGDNFVVDLTQ